MTDNGCGDCTCIKGLGLSIFEPMIDAQESPDLIMQMARDACVTPQASRPTHSSGGIHVWSRSFRIVAFATLRSATVNALQS